MLCDFFIYFLKKQNPSTKHLYLVEGNAGQQKNNQASRTPSDCVKLKMILYASVLQTYTHAHWIYVYVGKYNRLVAFPKGTWTNKQYRAIVTLCICVKAHYSKKKNLTCSLRGKIKLSKFIGETTGIATYI